MADSRPLDDSAIPAGTLPIFALATLGEDRTVRVWDIGLDAWTKAAIQIAGRFETR